MSSAAGTADHDLHHDKEIVSIGDDSPSPVLLPAQDLAHDLTKAVRPLGAWIFLATVLNIVLATADALPGDLEFWVDWTRQLTNRGYADLFANYPPVFMHCLWLIGKFQLWVGLTAESDLLMRFLVNTPVLLAHIGLIALVARVLRNRDVTDRQWNMLVGFVVLNPALLIDGPIWGQVDVIFCLFVALALWLLIEGRALSWVFPLLVSAVLTKFQAICIAPVVLPLLWHRRSKALALGVLPAAGIAVLLLLPYWLAGSAGAMIKQAYVDAASLFPVATLHADNLWYLLGLDQVDDGIYIFDRMQRPDSWRWFFTVKPFGIFLFGVWSTILLVSSWRQDEPDRHWRNAALCALGFFVWLPGMHERYLMPAVVLALVGSAQCWRLYPLAIVLTCVVSLNMLFLLRLSGGLLPYAVAGCVVFYSLALISEPYWAHTPWRKLAKAPLAGWLILALCSWLIALHVHVRRVSPDIYVIANGIDATLVRGRTSHQEWGKLGVDASVVGKRLSIAGKPFLKGFGTHAESRITIPVPEAARTFTVQVGMDDGGAGEVEFQILVDGEAAWNSGLMRAGETARSATVDVSGKRMLELIVDPQGINHGDHADWVEPRFEFSP